MQVSHHTLLSAKVSWLWDCAPVSSLTSEQVSPSLFLSPSNARFCLSFRSQLSPPSFNWNIASPGIVFLIYVRKFYFQIVFPLFWNSSYLPPPVYYCFFFFARLQSLQRQRSCQFCSSCFCCYYCFRNAFNICPIVALKSAQWLFPELNIVTELRQEEYSHFLWKYIWNH